jgi:hypothetical protein
VIGLKGHEAVLVIGNSAFNPWLTEHDGKDLIFSAPRPREAEKFLRDGAKFEKVVIGREVSYSNDNILRAAALLTPGDGLLAFFPGDESDEWQFKRALEFYYPTAQVWEAETTYGRVVMSNPFGASWRIQ